MHAAEVCFWEVRATATEGWIPPLGPFQNIELLATLSTAGSVRPSQINGFHGASVRVTVFLLLRIAGLVSRTSQIDCKLSRYYCSGTRKSLPARRSIFMPQSILYRLVR